MWQKSTTLPPLYKFKDQSEESDILWIVVDGKVIKGWYSTDGGYGHWNSYETKSNDLNCSHWQPINYKNKDIPNPPDEIIKCLNIESLFKIQQLEGEEGREE